MPKKIYIRTFGCQMNVRDSEIVLGMLLNKGYKQVARPEEAGLILFNTCSVRQHAEDRAISNMGALLKAKNSNQKSKIFGIIGCTAQALKEGLFKRLPGLDIVCGTGEIYRLPELVEGARQARVFACNGINKGFPEILTQYREDKNTAYVLISRGCSNFCSYCVVPYLRGKERSRRMEDIVKEIEDLVRQGIKEITLLGQNVNSYRSASVNFVQLLQRINSIDGVEKVKFLTSHPKDARVELFRAMKDLDKVVKQLHLPLQSGADRILKLMNRGYAAGRYKSLIKQLRYLLPECKITTDLMVGFPGESWVDFKKTYELMKEIKFDLAYIFKYSPRPFTQATKLKDDVAKQEKERRHRILLEYQKQISRSKRTNSKSNR